MNPDIFESDDVAKSCPVSYRTIDQYCGITCRPSFSRVNPDTMGCMWKGEFDLNTLRVDGEIFESGKKKLRIQKYPDTRGLGLRELYKYKDTINDIITTVGRLDFCHLSSVVDIPLREGEGTLRSETVLFQAERKKKFHLGI